MIKKTFLILLLFALPTFAQTSLSNKYRLAQTYEQTGNLERAKVIYEEITKAQPNNNQFANALNDIYLRLKEYDKSIKFLSNRIKQRPNDVTLYGMLGATYYISGNSEKAIETWDKGISLNNNSQVNYTVISNFAVQNRAFEIAIKYLEEGKEKSTDKTQFAYQLAQIYSYTMNYGKATEEYCSILLLQPSQLKYIERRMESYLSGAGALEQSIAVAKEYKDKVIVELLAFLYVKDNQYSKAFELVKKLDSNKGTDGVLIYNFASEAYRNSYFDVASNAFEYLINKYPDSKYIPNSKIGFAKTLESKLNKEWEENQQNWKPIKITDTTNSFKYIPIIETYESIIPRVKGELKGEALFRIGNIYFTKFLNYEKATNAFDKTVKFSSFSKYYGKAYLELAKIYIKLNDLKTAKKSLKNLFNSSKTDNGTKEEAKYLLAKIKFYESDFAGSLLNLADINKNLSNDLSNDAIELSIIINMGKRDSLSLVEFADAELKTEQLKFEEAEKEFKNLSEKENLFFLNNISRIKYAEILIAQNKYPVAIEILKELSEKQEMNIFADRSFYLLAQVYEFGVNDLQSAKATYQKFLELFPNSLYLDKAQENLKNLNNKESETI